MNYMKLIKIMYVIDRMALIKWGRPVTFDSYFSMDNGPVLSRTLELIDEGSEYGSPWGELILRAPNDPYSVTLRRDHSTDELSQAEEELASEIYAKLGHMNRWRIVDLLHQILPEWQNPHESSLPISYRDILRAAKKSEQEIAEIEFEIEGIALMEDLAIRDFVVVDD